MADATHAKLSASGAHRWAYCAGSVRAEEGLPDTTSPAAAEGTIAHTLASESLLHGNHLLDCHDDIDMAESVRNYTDYCRYIGKGAEVVLIEKRVDFSEWVPGGFGTADYIAIKDGIAHIVDLKFGRGVRVHAQNNPQGILYALGVLAGFGFMHHIDSVTISIVQPRLDHIDEWSISVTELRKLGEWLAQRAEEALAKNAARTAGENQCRFCKAKARCQALKTLTEETMMIDFDDISAVANPDTLTIDNLADILSNKALITGWFDAVEREVRRNIESGQNVVGWKLVDGRASRRWSDENEALNHLVNILGKYEAAVTTKILSPAQAEKALGKEKRSLLADKIITLRGSPSLVRSEDPRPAVNASIDDFGEVPND